MSIITSFDTYTKRSKILDTGSGFLTAGSGGFLGTFQGFLVPSPGLWTKR